MNKIPYLFLIILIFSCKDKSNKTIQNSENEYTINATVENLKDSLTIVLSNIDWKNRRSIDIDSTYSINGKFNFKGELPNPGLHALIIKDYKNMVGKAVQFWFANGEIKINGNYDNFQNSTILGSPSNELHNQYLKLDNNEKLSFIFKNSDNPFSLSTIMENPQLISQDSLRIFYSNLNSKLKKSKNGLALKDFITTEKIKIGSPFKDFEARDLDGNKVNLSDFKGKIILLDFWANWCHFCHEQNKSEFAHLNKKYNKNEFVLISYSLDTKKELWEKSSNSDNIDWVNISNIKGMNDPIVALFNLHSLPQSFLIDKNGIIVKTFKGYNSENNIIEQEIDKLIDK